ncbi:hypothetical protein [Rugamonas sp. DEMB1]|uniref:hypothetical protein n=1 Tax=Rugamonas sp. DEMB1 TaxID=3039386 RepID=UPI002449F2FB|nr:hypothetical protein [Rugamonas sp. DEMB1]WGG49136.1 hypothetical protein QC826_21355 [Rugamonas sp. DEMB1]
MTGYDNWSSQAASASRGQFSWVDMHSYFAEPSNFVAAGSVMRQDSMLGSGLLYITDLAVSRYHGKAFSVSEYGQVFWNKYRRESALAVPAYAAFQNWGMIAQHAGGFTMGYDERGGRKDRIYPFMVGPDPVLRANETLAALLFLRGDVARAKHQLRLKLEDWYTFEGNGIYSSVAQDVRRLTMVQGVGIDWLGQANSYDVQMAPYSSAVKVYKPTAVLPTATATTPASLPAAGNEAGVTVEQMYGNRVTVLRNGGVLAPSARDNTVYGVFLTDTGEVALDRNRRRLTVVTPKTEGAVFDVLETIQLSNVRIDAPTGPALLTVSAMDGANLNASKRMLLVLATDARNTGMTFADPGADTTLKSLGTGPVLIQAVSLKVKLLNVNAASLKVFSNKLNGSRGDPIPVVQEAGGISFTLDTSKLSHGPTTYFEIATK